MQAASKQWTFAAGMIPEHSTGREPDNTSRNVLCLLNTGSEEACAEVTFYYSDQEPVGPYLITLPAERVRHIRVNDLIDPEAIPLGSSYGMTIACDQPVTAQLIYVDTSYGRYAVTALPGIPGS